ncbi:MAG: NRDE family protein [Clostridia bacterium]|jgi:uncharacterized protein with NRDE domain|nr:NRDE family protein [Clostridia bacterium]
MCLILVAFNCSPQYRLVIAANRDEYYARPTAGASFWPDCPNILAGRDLEQRGTWLGLTKNGRWGAVTNYRDPRQVNPEARSRGELVSRYLQSGEDAAEYLQRVQPQAEAYNGFNLFLGDRDSLYYYGNRAPGVKELHPGIYGLSNHLLDTPWTKVEKGKRLLRTMLQEDKTLDFAAVFAGLADQEQALDSELPDTGVGLERERLLSSLFIAGAEYGTRSSCIITVDRNNRAVFAERSYGQGDTQITGERLFEFDIIK